MGLDVDSIIGSTSFTLIDYVVVGISLGVVLFCGLYHVFVSSSSPEHFLVGNRNMGSFSIAASIAVLFFSALSIMENPADIYYHGIESFMMLIITVVVVPFSAFLFVPMFHSMQLTSLHQYIGHRFDSTVLRVITSLTYILQQLFLTCVVLGAVSSALKDYFDVPMRTSLIGIGIFTAINTTLGGFKANVWTQVFHYVWIMLFLTALAIVSGSKAGGFLHAVELAAKHDRLRLDNFTLDPFMRHNFYNFVVGYGFMTLIGLVTSQPVVQRYSSLPTRKEALKSIFMSIALLILPSLLCLIIGVFLLSVYAGCDPMTFGHINRPQDIVYYFIIKNLKFFPGFMGFFTACIVGGGISVCSTSIISTTACTYQDFISKMGCCKSKDDPNMKGQSICCRVISATFTILATGLTYLSMGYGFSERILSYSTWSNLITFNSVLLGPLAAILIMGLFLPCINKYVRFPIFPFFKASYGGATIGFLGGVACMGYVAVRIIKESETVPVLHPIMGECRDKAGLNMTFLKFIPWHPIEEETTVKNLPLTANIDDIFHISYLLLTLLGAVVTMAISFPVSVLTGGLCFCTGKKVSAFMLHPFLRFSDCCIDTEKRELQHAISHRYVDRIASVHNLFPGNVTRLDSKPPSYRYSSVPTTPLSP